MLTRITWGHSDSTSGLQLHASTSVPLAQKLLCIKVWNLAGLNDTLLSKCWPKITIVRDLMCRPVSTQSKAWVHAQNEGTEAMNHIPHAQAKKYNYCFQIAVLARSSGLNNAVFLCLWRPQGGSIRLQLTLINQYYIQEKFSLYESVKKSHCLAKNKVTTLWTNLELDQLLIMTHVLVKCWKSANTGWNWHWMTQFAWGFSDIVIKWTK